MLLNAAAILAALATGCAVMRVVYTSLNDGLYSLNVWLCYGAAMLAHLTVPALGVIVWRQRKAWWPALPLLSLALSAVAVFVLAQFVRMDGP